jgi:O-antigen ligase
MLALAAERTWKFGFSDFRNWTIMGAALLLGALSANRSRILFSAAIIFVVSYIYNRLSKNVLLFIVIGTVAIMGVVLTGIELPAPVSRTLSIILPSNTSSARNQIREYGLSEEMGLASPFRVELLKRAWRNIRRHPIKGKGFNFSLKQYWTAPYRLNTMDPQFQMLEATGGYHNSLVELAVACGVPVVIIFCIGYFGILIPFVKQLRITDNYDIKVLFAGILGLFVAESGQLLMNGFATDYYIISLLLGIMHYSKSVMAVPPDEDDKNDDNSANTEINKTSHCITSM